jgi:NAD(P)-dependent dehydrogenase (short-subunit alcohol dehydrogenase family)
LSSYSHVHLTLESNPIAAEEPVIAHFGNIKKYVSGKRYQDGKLVINAFIQRLASIVPSSEVIINCVCPGIVATDINQNLPLWIKPFMCVFFMIKARPVTEGGRVLVRAAVVVGEESHGRYLQTGEIHR